MVARPYVFMHKKRKLKDNSFFFLIQFRRAGKTIVDLVIYSAFSDSCVQLSGKEKEATMSRTIQKNTQRKGEQYNGNIKRIIRKFIGKNRS